jgi:hypothetical protein
LLVQRHPRIEAPAAWESIATESATSWFPEFRRTVFVDVADDIRNPFTGATSELKDRQLVDALDASPTTGWSAIGRARSPPVRSRSSR